MSGWILDTGAVYNADQRALIVASLGAVRRAGHRVVVPNHVFLELARQEVQHQRKLARLSGLTPELVTPASVVGDLRAQLQNVEYLPFTVEDAMALLAWLDEPLSESWNVLKRRKAVDDGWHPILKALEALPCPACSQGLVSCQCSAKLWTANMPSHLKQAAQAACTSTRRHASATMDWLTVAMARRHGLTPVTTETAGAEWATLARKTPEAFAADLSGY